MKIAVKVVLMNVLFLASVALLGGISVFQLFALDEMFDKAKIITSAVRAQGEADMMHDGLRADVLFAIKAGLEKDASKRDEAIATTKDHADNFRNLIKEVGDADLSVAVEQKLADLQEPLDRYISSAVSMTQEAMDHPENVSAGYDAFEKDFEYLEGAMEEFSTVIEAEYENVNTLIGARKASFLIVLAIALSLAVALVVLNAVISSRSIVKPIRSLSDVMAALAAKDLGISVPFLDRKDEIGAMANVVMVFKSALQRESEAEAFDLLEREKKEEKLRAIESVFENFKVQVEGVVGTLSKSSGELEVSAKSMADNAEKSSLSVDSALHSADSSSSSVSSVASASEELSASIQEITRQMGQSSRIAEDAQAKANVTLEQMNKLVEATNKIGQFIGLITEIAEQTNLLALNATIESARAGEAGKGFAVVAGEVKNLAGQTAKATEDIANQIKDVQNATSNSNNSIREIVDAINAMKETAQMISEAVTQQGEATSEISRSVQEASTQTYDVGQGIQKIHAFAGDTKKTAQTVLDSAQNLAGQSAVLADIVDDFLTRVKAVA